MAITAIENYLYGATPVTTQREPQVDATQGFQSMLDSVMKLMDDTNAQIKNANREQVAFALGETDNTHDLMVAEKKANIALQYTVAVRDRVLEAYQQIMQMQI
ncbi:flagellar hook-basal body complex protein FliE [Pseudobutyrivibrio xylanivorans]|uniref:Flagellar hook-basal body complex protein FliE n=1 Tax=Pseudobutyrivibrio xylanivorans TaxID=185007 RepID=A0A5P6VS03_PSEXY|nr:flagellar hook-basal body complex protein FliE [Pseudobutyrivibrio xylanivorans]QFJ55475.1 flagellar hook-basal body complex protein FliE [Pseudobutyrivibrio xylanivorans]